MRYFLHTNLAADGFEGGVNIPALCAQLGIGDKVIFCDQERYRAGFPDVYLHALYCATDVLNAVSLGEGFGIPTLESQACGTPVIVSDFAAQRDLCFAGWKVLPSPLDGEREGLRFYDGQGAWVFIPEPQAIADRMEMAYALLQSDDQRRLLSDAALAGAEDYRIDTVVQRYWKPAIEELQASIASEGSRGVLRIIRREEVLSG